MKLKNIAVSKNLVIIPTYNERENIEKMVRKVFSLATPFHLLIVEDKVSIKTTLNDATINVTPDLVGGSISMISMAGQVVKTIVISDVNTTISFEGIDSGIYSVVANFEAGSVNKRVYIK